MTEQAGSVLDGRYRLGEPIGRGGMGTVWRATDLVLDRDVAIKLLRFSDDPGARARFRREARTLARLSHPRLGGVYDYGEEDGRAYTVMEFLTGETLQYRLARVARVPAAAAAEIAAQVAEGLQAAHQVGVIHRDVKPANIILTGRGARLVDFGIAVGAGDDRLTATGTLIGSAAYLAPERATGQAATPASDLYSLGVVLHQMLAGRPPFHAMDAVELVSAHAREPVPPLPADVPAAITRACCQAMAKDPAARPASAAAFAAMLAESRSRGRHAAVTAAPAPQSQRTTLPANGSGEPQPRPPSGKLPAAEPPSGKLRAAELWPQVQVLPANDPPPAGGGPHGYGQRTSGDWLATGGGIPTASLLPRVGGWTAGDGPATQTLPVAQDRAPAPPRARRWWLAAVATVVAIMAASFGTALVAGGPGPRHAAARPTAAAHRIRPPAPPSAPGGAPPGVTWTLTTPPQPQGVPPAPPNVLAPPGETVLLRETLRNISQQPISDLTLSLSAPPGWTVTPAQPASTATVPAGATAAVTWQIAVPAGTQPGAFPLAAVARCAPSTPCGSVQATGNAVVPYASFSQAFDNAGIAPQADGGAANLDGTGQSYQEEALAGAGYLPGAQVSHDGISFEWPDAQPGAPDNVAAQGQTFLLPATGAHLAFLGASDFGTAGGDGIIYYQDGTQQPFHLVMDDWWTNAPKTGQDEVAATFPQFNGPPGQPPPGGPPVAVYFASVPLQAGRTVAAVTLPAGAAPSGGVACLHLFAVAVG